MVAVPSKMLCVAAISNTAVLVDMNVEETQILENALKKLSMSVIFIPSLGYYFPMQFTLQPRATDWCR